MKLILKCQIFEKKGKGKPRIKFLDKVGKCKCLKKTIFGRMANNINDKFMPILSF